MNIYQEFDSGKFPYIDQSIEHSKTNPFLMHNFTNEIRFALNDGNVIAITEPMNIIKDLIYLFEDNIFTRVLPEEEYYKPEQTAYNLYGSHDFWYVIMLLNNCFTFLEYDKKEIKYINPNELYRIEKFIGKSSNNVRFIQSADVVYPINF